MNSPCSRYSVIDWPTSGHSVSKSLQYKGNTPYVSAQNQHNYYVYDVLLNYYYYVIFAQNQRKFVLFIEFIVTNHRAWDASIEKTTGNTAEDTVENAVVNFSIHNSQFDKAVTNRTRLWGLEWCDLMLDMRKIKMIFKVWLNSLNTGQ